MNSMRLRHMLQTSPSAKEVAGEPLDTEVTFAPMEAISDGAGGLNIANTKPLGDLLLGSYNYFRDGDLLLAKVTPCFENGKRALAQSLMNGIGFATSEVHVLRPDERRVDPRFLYHLTASEDFRAEGMRSMTGAGGLRRVSESAILNYQPAVTDLPTQKRIAAFLDRETGRIDELIGKKERLVSLLKEHGTSAREELLWGEGGATKLGHHVNILPGYAFASTSFTDNPEDIRLLRGANVGVDEVRWDDVVYWPAADAVSLERFSLTAGDLVMGMDRPWISEGIRVAEVREEDLPCLLLQRVCKITPRSTLDTRYLKALIASRRFLAYFEPILTGVSVPHISGDQIANFRFPFIERIEQGRRMDKLASITNSNAPIMRLTRSSIDRLREYRAALITAAVTGQIDVDNYGKAGKTSATLERIEEEMLA